MLKRLGDLIYLAFYGARDALKLHNTLLFFLTSPLIRRRSFQCFLLNGVLFVGGVFVYQFLVRPFISSFLPENPSTPEEIEYAQLVQWYSETGFQVFWILPIYLLSFTLNGLWYNDIADAAFVLQYQVVVKKKKGGFSIKSFFLQIAQDVYRALLTLSYMIVMKVVSMIPFVGSTIGFVFLCWLYSLYAFEFKWNKDNWIVDQKLTYMENHSVYFFGFGCPVAAITVVFPRYVNGGFYAMMFPMFLLLTTATNPEKAGVTDVRFPIFSLAKKINFFMIRYIDKCKKRSIKQ